MERAERPPHGDGRHPSRQRVVAVGVLFVLLILSVIPWRSDTIYQGGVDAVVVGKAIIAVFTLALAMVLYTRTPLKVPIGLGPAAVLVTVLLISLLGSIVSGYSAATSVIVVRIGIAMATVLLVLSSVRWEFALGGMMAAMAVWAVVAATTGIGTLFSEGRLGGRVPEIHPNEVAGLAGAPLVAMVIWMLRTRVRPWRVLVAVLLLAIVIASGSRTALLGVLIAIGIALLTNGLPSRGVVYLILVTLPVVYTVVFFTGIVESLVTRSGSTDATSALDARFEAWRVVLAWDWQSWQKWIGVGLAVKKVKVNLQWREDQVLDSSWASLLAQTGLLGTVLVAGLVAWCLIGALVSSSRRGALLPLLVLLVLRSFTESGLVDSAVPFLLFLVLATLLTHRSRHAGDLPPPLEHRDDSQRAPAVRGLL
ncbi:O-antigen ligase family protein [Microbacterium sp. BK668]|uniref:O-antigen ligase family protein n=1 Tax=Microbacterium sp. BK668 TaxID=2512118 RepID=UPI00105BFC91|nr:O-antigen ligase family protein [Microbacterium sp. BK668]TDN90832.1 O-antigen ligase-like membrane protein [Microbacterium sp. BK668]